MYIVSEIGRVQFFFSHNMIYAGDEPTKKDYTWVKTPGDDGHHRIII